MALPVGGVAKLMSTESEAERAALDAYSQVVTGVAERVLPSVAALSVRTARGGGAGSAVTFTDDGFLLTSAHVVTGATGGTATFGDGLETRFDVVGADPLSDLAVLRAQATGAPPAELGDADGLRIGQLVVAVGNPIDKVEQLAFNFLKSDAAKTEPVLEVDDSIADIVGSFD